MDPGMQMKHIFKARSRWPMTHKNEYKWLYLQFYRWLYLDTSLYLTADPYCSFNSHAVAVEENVPSTNLSNWVILYTIKHIIQSENGSSLHLKSISNGDLD